MAAQMTVNLLLEKTRQHLLKYFETREDIKVKRLESDSVQVRNFGWRPAPWMNIKIGMTGEENRTRLAFNFDFRMAYAVITIALVLALAVIWAVGLVLQTAGVAIGATIGILITIPIAFVKDLSDAKKRSLDDIRKAFDINKTD